METPHHTQDDGEGDVTSDAITADYRILQRRGGHRYSLDDVATAWEAVHARACQDAELACLDLGCGTGSVLLMVAYKLRRARLWGIEAQPLSAGLAQKSVALNGVADRATIFEGDLREVCAAWPHPRCALITGTPPYLPLGTALASPDPQRAAARIELRGGVEDYLAAASRVLAPGGKVVLCADARRPERVLRGAEAAELRPIRCREVIPRAGAAALFSVWTLEAGNADEGFEELTLTVRDADGAPTAEARSLRRCFGL